MAALILCVQEGEQPGERSVAKRVGAAELRASQGQ